MLEVFRTVGVNNPEHSITLRVGDGKPSSLWIKGTNSRPARIELDEPPSELMEAVNKYDRTLFEQSFPIDEWEVDFTFGGCGIVIMFSHPEGYTTAIEVAGGEEIVRLRSVIVEYYM